MLTRRAATIVAASALVFSGVSACGEDRPSAGEEARGLTDAGSSSTAPSSTPPAATGEAEPGQSPAGAYAGWLNALARQDAAAACELQAPELTIALRQEAILVDRAELGDPCVGFEALLWEEPDFTSQISDIAVTQVTAEDALLEVHLVDPTPEQTDNDEDAHTVRMVYHRAKWRVFSVDERTGEGEAVPGDATRWVESWCDLDPSMTREELIAAMGEPSGEYTVSDGGEPQLWWAQDQYDFRAYLDVDGSVLELVGDYDALSEADRALLPCPELRN